MLTAEEIVKSKRKKYVSISPETRIVDAIKTMVEHKEGTILAILDETENAIKGIWTERDLMRNMLREDFNPQNARIKDYMVTELVVADYRDTIENLIQTLVNKNTRHLLIQKEDEFIGMLSSEDILNASLTEKEKDYNRLFEQVGCGVYISSKAGKFLNVNQALLDMLDYKDKSQFLNKDIGLDIYYNPEDRKKFQEKIEKEKRIIDYEVKFKKQNGEAIPVLITCHLRYDSNHNITGYEGIIMDLTQRKKMEQELFQAQMQLLQSEKLADMGKLTSQIAHEMNNPMYGIMNTLELLKTEISPSNRRRKLLDMSINEIYRLTEMLKKMLSYSSQSQDTKQILDVNPIMDETILSFQNQLKEKNIDYELSLNVENKQVNASKKQLKQVFNDIIKNAIEAMKKGGKLNINTSSDNEHVLIEIKDTGIGIKEENMDKIFESFYTTKSSVYGVGLGLSACYGFIKNHGGEIKVESKVDVGSSFTIILPVHHE